MLLALCIPVTTFLLPLIPLPFGVLAVSPLNLSVSPRRVWAYLDTDIYPHKAGPKDN